jgi:hypothetical protein
MLHTNFGLFAPRNGTVIVVLPLCALSMWGAIFLILEMSRPLNGMIKVPSAPRPKAIDLLGRQAANARFQRFTPRPSWPSLKLLSAKQRMLLV